MSRNRLLIFFLILSSFAVIVVSYNKNSKPTKKKSSRKTVEDKKQKELEVEKKKIEEQKQIEEEQKNKALELMETLGSSFASMARDPVFWGSLVAKPVLIAALKQMGKGSAILFAKMVPKVAATVAAKTSTATATTAAKTAVKVGLGPVGWGLLAFDLLSLSLDLGDALGKDGPGYAKMGTNKMYLEMRDFSREELKKGIEAEGVKFPIYIGPAETLSKAKIEEYTALAISSIMNPNRVPIHPIAEPMFSALKRDLESGNIKDGDLEKEGGFDKYSDMIDDDKFAKEISKILCLKSDGMMIKDSDGNDVCTYKNKESCIGSYSWPTKEDDVYAEWIDGSCQLSDQTLRNVCEDNKLEYDHNIRSCKIDRDYCLTKGADWVDGDCKVEIGQQLFEAMFGTTVVRGLRQIFDTAMYEECKDGEVDDGYFCRKMSCPADNPEEFGGVCYPKCKDGYSGAGVLCWANCAPGYQDYGVGCSKPLATIPDREECPPNSEPNFVGDCYGKKADREDGVNGAEPWGLYEDGTGDGGDGCSWNRHIEGGMCFRDCPEGYFGRAHEGCFANGANSFGVMRYLVDRKMICPQGKRLWGGLCYADCPEGTTDIGATCTKNTYGRGVGVIPDTNIRVKQRRIDFSSKDN